MLQCYNLRTSRNSQVPALAADAACEQPAAHAEAERGGTRQQASCNQLAVFGAREPSTAVAAGVATLRLYCMLCQSRSKSINCAGARKRSTVFGLHPLEPRVPKQPYVHPKVFFAVPIIMPKEVWPFRDKATVSARRAPQAEGTSQQRSGDGAWCLLEWRLHATHLHLVVPLLYSPGDIPPEILQFRHIGVAARNKP